MDSLQSLEKALDDIFVKRASPLPAGAKKALLRCLPWVNLALGLLALYTVYLVWAWAHLASNRANGLNPAYSGPLLAGGHMTAGLWLGLAILAAEAGLYLAAFAGTRQHKKSGWNLMFYALLVNIVYGVAILFTSYRSAASLLSTVAGSAVGLYLLFQIRDSYSQGGRTAKKVT